MIDAQRFPIRFTGLNKAMAVLGLTRRLSYVDVSPTRLTVRMSWAFNAAIDRSSLTSVEPDDSRPFGWGAHGWRGEWLINGSSSGLVRLAFDPPGRGRLLGVVPLTVRVVRVAVEQPDQLIAALTAPGSSSL